MRRTHSRYAVVLVTLLICRPLFPATIEVNETCTLVDAINAANNDDDSGGLCPPGGSGTDTLILTDNVVLHSPYSHTQGLPAITTDIVIDGQGFAIERRASAEDEFRIFTIGGHSAEGNIVIRNTTISNGISRYGAAMFVRDYGTATILNSTLSGNYARHDPYQVGGGRGGAIYNQYGTLTINNSTLSNNRATRSGGAIHHTIGGGVTTITNSTLSGNSWNGSAIYVSRFYEFLRGHSPDVVVENTTFYGNSGRAIYNNGRLVITDSTFFDNSTAVYAYGGSTSLTNTTFSANGVAIFAYRGGVTATNSTLTGNDVGIYAFYINGEVTLTGSIVAGNTSGGDCAGGGDFVDGGDNFDSDGSCPGAAPIIPGVDFDTTLADNGGPTQTHALLPGSVAQDAAGECGLETDQRGVPRSDGACDSGSFEIVPGACCTDGPGVESECIETEQGICEAEDGRFLGVGSECRPDIDCVALLVTMESMSAEAVPQGVVVRWTTAMETDTVGFRVLRQSTNRREKALQPVGAMVPALGSEVEGGSYELLDDSPAAARAFQYFIEDIDLFGRVTRHGPIVVDRCVRDRRAIRVAPRR